MKKISLCIVSTFLLVVILLSMTIHPALAARDSDNLADSNAGTIAIEIAVIDQATVWLEKNYSEFYDLRKIDADIIRVFENDSEIRYTVAVSCETLLKYDDVKDLPFVQGLNSAVTDRKLQLCEEVLIDSFISEVDANIDEYRGLTLDLVIVIDKEAPKAPWKMYSQDGMETTLYEIEELELDAKEMYDAGRSAIDDILKEASVTVNPSTRGYSSYDRLAARDYALDWSSSPNTCYDDGTNCGTVQNRSLWNNSVYPYHSVFKHNDCANFISQAMSAGGLPESGDWFRTKNVSTASWGSAWTSVSLQKAYMTDSSRKYWDSSTYATCVAGNILHTSSSHVVMITLNDTVTHRFTGHTNDRRDYIFTNSSGYKYYKII